MASAHSSRCQSKIQNMTEKDKAFVMWRGREVVTMTIMSVIEGKYEAMCYIISCEYTFFFSFFL